MKQTNQNIARKLETGTKNTNSAKKSTRPATSSAQSSPSSSPKESRPTKSSSPPKTPQPPKLVNSTKKTKEKANSSGPGGQSGTLKAMGSGSRAAQTLAATVDSKLPPEDFIVVDETQKSVLHGPTTGEEALAYILGNELPLENLYRAIDAGKLPKRVLKAQLRG